MLDHLSLPEAERTYLHELTKRLRTTLAPSLVAVYLFGSASRNAYIPGQSDLDVQAVIFESLPPSSYTFLASVISHSSLPCPASKLEFVLYSSTEAQSAHERAPRYEINFNTGRTMPKGDYLSLDSTQDAEFWFVLDIAAGREVAVGLFGPPAADVFAAPCRMLVLESLKESLEWHEGEERGLNGLANGARAWRWLREGMEWLRKQWSDWSVLERWDELQGDQSLEEDEVGRFLRFLKGEVEEAMQQEQS